MKVTDSQKITPEQASRILGISPNEIRYCLRQGTLPIGHARKASRGRGYRYDIFLPLVLKYIGKENQP